MIILDGKKLSKQIEATDKKRAHILIEKNIVPTLAIILVGEDKASKIYIQKKISAGLRVGVKVNLYHYKEDTKTEEVLAKINDLNIDKSTHGIIVQLPLPEQIDKQEILEQISPEKDVDGVHPLNWGRLAYKKHDFIPCTPAAIMEILKEYNISIKGKEVLIIGKSEIVGKPLAILLMNEEATLTIAHKGTKDLVAHTKNADIIISATGVPGLINSEMIKEGVVLVDVGIIRIGSKVVGDIDFESASKKAAAITPVPGGIGPVTVSMLLRNVILFAEKRTA
ncbi:bifunctional 5,10-methylenetetrahydrofolate dehydrogenase/5,10-methenyltetrahydrofolate cyclohydrolase [bacterium]|nr:bifunctional 5,10-methylenetetrahydrofolate dehydrogenase/5,10-methenyltetrahydrofolate cyclohydrolase [bacterium]